MKRPAGPLFVARRSYRVRRLRDAARLVPVLGAFLFLVPLLWEPAPEQPRNLARDAIYVFGVWAGLVIVSAVLSRRLRQDTRGNDPVGAGDKG